MKAAIEYSVATGTYTIEQLEAQVCAECGADFQPGEVLEPVFLGDDFELYAHSNECPPAVPR